MNSKLVSKAGSYCAAATTFLTTFVVLNASANPHGMTVVAGSGSASQNGNQLNITVGDFTMLNWNSFDILSGETTRFIQPGAGSIVFNQIGSANPSQIWGNLTANGTVILANSHGFYFGPNSMIKVGGSFIATTAALPPDFGPGASWQFTGPPPLASIVNYGQIQAGQGHSLFLIAERVENHGELSAPRGNVGLLAGQSVLVSERPDGRGLSASVTLPSGSVDNSGTITADAGVIALQAQVVNQNGIIQANSVREHHGVIELIASDQLNLGDDSRILAQGDANANRSSGGTVTLKSGNEFSDSSGSEIVTTGGARGGNGGNVEVSAPNILSLDSRMDAGASSGFRGGQLLLDPDNIILGTSGSGSAGNGTVGAGDGSGTLSLNVNTAFANMNFSRITLQANANITLSQGTIWNLSLSTGVGSGLLTLQAGGDIIFGNGSQITDANNWSVNLQAGVNFLSGAVQSGIGNIYLNGGIGKNQTGTIQTSGGSIDLLAGQNILVGGGAVRTVGGGNINATALAGDINAGTANGGYQFSIFGYNVSPNLGGISTAAGGDVTLQAGNNIISQPTVPPGQTPGASGAYGHQHGDVTLIAGNQVLGNFTLANGTGTILAGVQVEGGQVTQITNPNAEVGSSQRPVSLSLIDGSWNVWAGRDLYISEVRNPNGTFNGNQLNVPFGSFFGNIDQPNVPTRTAFLFDYAPDAAANFWAGNSITLAGSNLPRINGQNQNMPPIYAPILTLNAGAGGINVLYSIVLYPSSEGSLRITTRSGGNLVGAQQQTTLTGITMSDSGLPNYPTFAQGHSVTPLHLNDPNPVTVNISGSIESFGLTVPTFANIDVAGSTYNFGFSGRNLSPFQTTSINVAGDITYRGNFTSVSLSEPLLPALLDPSLSGNASIASKLRYDPATDSLTFIGQMTQAELTFLLSPTVVVLDRFGQPVLDANGNPETRPVTLSAAQQAAIQQLYADSQSASLGDQGLALAGPGHFNITAHNIDLGISGGITVQAPDAALFAISPFGADLNVSFSGNLEMTSTKIANESYLGGITITGTDPAGTLNVGGQFTTFGDPNAPKGIFTTSGGDVSVAVPGDINVNGSRIATYNGGDITVESFNGNINAGSGGSGYVSMNALELDPVTGQLRYIPASMPGSGILATTLVGSHATPGNILVETPRGNITASLGGIVQLSFNRSDTSHTFTEVLAGYELRDEAGNRVLAGDLANGQAVRVSDGRNIDASGSGVIAQNLILSASGYINGFFISRGSLTAHSEAPPPPGSRPIYDSGDKPQLDLPQDPGSEPRILGNDASQAPAITESQPYAAPTEEAATALANQTDELGGGGGDDEKKKRKGIALAQKTSRVTVILPENTTPTKP